LYVVLMVPPMENAFIRRKVMCTCDTPVPAGPESSLSATAAVLGLDGPCPVGVVK
jgi:hypothetical protein